MVARTMRQLLTSTGICLLMLSCFMWMNSTRSGEEAREPVTLDLGNGVELKLNPIPAGTFTMGSPTTEEARATDEIQRQVTLSPFYMGVYPVTQSQYLAEMGINPSRFSGINHPVEQVSWGNAQEFCKKLSEKTGKTVRLPTEAEWEYACRAGATTAFSTGDTLTKDQANTSESGKGQTISVGSYPANAWGLFDMHGNVWEWCSDSYAAYPEGPAIDPKGSQDRFAARILRGGSWYSSPPVCRSATRNHDNGDYWYHTIGFRVVME